MDLIKKFIAYFMSIFTAVSAFFSVNMAPFYSYEYKIDSTSLGKALENPVSTVNIWSIEGNPFVNAKNNKENDIFDFVEYVQLMQCTGGTEQRDLFVNPLDKEVLDDYDFTILIENCKGILRLGAKPFLKLGNVPLKYSKNARTDTGFGLNLYPPDDYDVYYNYIYAIIQALCEEFGLDEVRSWRFGVMTEYENEAWFCADTNENDRSEKSLEAYCKLYDYTTQAVIDVLGEDIFIGAHSMTVTQGLWDEALFIKHCANGINYKTGERGTKLSYLSASFYDLKAGKFTDGKTLPETIAYLRNTAEENGLYNLIFGIDEGRIHSGTKGKESAELLSRAVGHTYQAAYDARMIYQMFNNDISYFSYWSYLSNGLLEGNPTVSYHVAKNASRFANAKEVSTSCTKAPVINNSEVNVFSAFNEADKMLNIMAYNFKNKLDYKKTISLKIDADLPQFEGKDIKITEYVINDDCNYFDEWVCDREKYNIDSSCFLWSPDDPEIDNPTVLNDEKARSIYFNELYPKYKECSRLVPKVSEIKASNGKITLNSKISPNSVVFYTVEIIE